MFWQRNLIIGLLLIGMLSLAMAQAKREAKLARVSLGMAPVDVIKLLGQPHATLIPQPPVIERTVASGGVNPMDMTGAMPTGMPGMGAMGDKIPENTLVLIMPDGEIELGGRETPPPTMVTVSAQGGQMGTTASGTGVPIPLWAYSVLATKLSLDQQELIYRINPTYSLGITINGQGKEAHVSDIVACSIEPLMEYYNKTTKKFERKKIDPSKLNFAYKVKNSVMLLPAGTSKGVLIGSSLEEVLRAHQWPQYFFPFASDKLGEIALDKNNAYPPPPAVPFNMMSGLGGGTSAGPSMGTPSADGSISPLSGEVAAGDKIVLLTDGVDRNYNVGFGKNCLLLYTADDAKVAFTIVDFTVVRIHIGNGVVPPPKPKPKTAAPGMGGMPPM